MKKIFLILLFTFPIYSQVIIVEEVTLYPTSFITAANIKGNPSTGNA